ncbi:MAG: response regulator [Gammaproteobacteria bacterium]|nr:response regulator [Gammaproteobacteria bacterium]MBQ0839608.1 response regulator [Gammaproteobacteria bacterium]
MSNNVEAILNQLRGVIVSGDADGVNVWLKDLTNESNQEAVNDAIRELGRIDVNLIVFLARFIAQNRGVSTTHPLLEDLLFEQVLASPDMLVEMLANSDDVQEIAYYIHCIESLALESATLGLETKLAAVSDEGLLISMLGAIAKIGYCHNPQNLADYLYASNRDIIAAAIGALGSIGSHEAVQLLSDRMGTDSDFDRLILDQFAEIQDQFCIEKLSETLASHITHVRNYGKAKLAEMGAKVIPVIIENLSSDDTDLVVHTLNVLGDIFDESAVKPIKNLLHNHPADANIRFAAYETLGRLPSQKIALALADGLNDKDDNVRLAASRAINNNYSRMLGVGVKNLLHSTVFDSENIIAAIVESESDNIFLDLLDEENVRDALFTYIREQAHSDVVKFFNVILAKNDRGDLLSFIQPKQQPEQKTKTLVYAIDDSRMILNIYRSALHKLGYEFKLFEFPETALKNIEQDAPEFVFTDLNMPLISGIDLTRKIREIYSADELPIVMVTTQSEDDSKDDALAAGVSEVIGKPFNADALKQAIERNYKPK